jgi:uncharacterized protein RhaS with RHS repeats
VNGKTAAETTTYEYNLVGNLDKVFLPGGMIADYEYDSLIRLDKLTHYEPDARVPLLASN